MLHLFMRNSGVYLYVWYSERFSRPKAFIGPKLVGLFQILDCDVEPERRRTDIREQDTSDVVARYLKAMPAKVSPSSTTYLQ